MAGVPGKRPQGVTADQIISTSKGDLPFALKAKMAWGGAATPDWIEELAALADQLALKATGQRVGYSTTAVSNVLNNKYTGDMNAVEDAVRGALMGLTVDCPAQGEITKDVCLGWQKKPRTNSDSTSVRVYRACRAGCEHSRLRSASNNPPSQALPASPEPPPEGAGS